MPTEPQDADVPEQPPEPEAEEVKQVPIGEQAPENNTGRPQLVGE